MVHNNRIIIQKIFHAQDELSHHSCLLYLRKGQLKLTLGKKLYSLSAGDAAILPPNTFYWMQKEEGADDLLLGYDAEGDPKEPMVITLSERGRMFAAEIANQRENDPQIYPLLELLLLQIYDSTPRAAEPAERDFLLFTKASAYLEENIPTRLSVGDLAEHLGISLSHLKRVFARYAGMGAHDYFNILKIQRAKELLARGHSVTQTAELVGFANQAYFSAAFKRITGRQAKEYFGEQRAPRAPRKPVSDPAPRAPQSPKDLPSYLL
ncbi:MAG: helix-turn-helix transcriptional regulator [Clostridia bacterium]|nr:helix-turn-helix transcriptional regulator [Clostridia bacterium]